MKKFLSFFAAFCMFFIISTSAFALHPACLGQSISPQHRCLPGAHNGAIGTGCGCCARGFLCKREFSSIVGYTYVCRCN